MTAYSSSVCQIHVYTVVSIDMVNTLRHRYWRFRIESRIRRIRDIRYTSIPFIVQIRTSVIRHVEVDVSVTSVTYVRYTARRRRCISDECNVCPLYGT